MTARAAPSSGSRRRRRAARRTADERRPRHELASWLALGIAVAAVVVLTTARPVHASRSGVHGERSAEPSRGRRREGSATVPPSAPPRYATKQGPLSSGTTRLPAAPTTAAPTRTSTVATTSPSARPTRRAGPAANAPSAGAPPPSTPPGPAVVTVSWPGNLQYPDDVSAAFALRTSGGVVSATAAWSGAPELRISVVCAGGSRSATGTTGLYVSAVGEPGNCEVTIAEPVGTAAVVSYSLVAHYPAQRR